MTRNNEGTFELLGVVDTENNGNQSRPERPDQKTFIFEKNTEFLLLRWLLKALSLWGAKSSCCFNRYFYPAFVNFLLACITVCYIVILALKKGGDVTYSAISVVMSTGGFLGHIAALFYLRSRDIEENMICITLKGSQLEKFGKQLKYFNARMVIYVTAFSCFIFPILIGTINNSRDRSVTTYLVDSVYSSQDLYRQCLLSLVSIAHVYIWGVYMAIIWVIDLLQLMSNIRLQEQHRKFTNWKEGAEEAINDHIYNYILKVENSCRGLKWWFLIHIISLVIMVPVITMGNLDLVISERGSFVTAGFEIATMIFMWALPLYFAEKIEKHDKNFRCVVNNFCPDQLCLASTNSQETVYNMHGVQNEENVSNLTFMHRTEVQLVVDYLNSVRSGFQSVGYAFQLKLSFISTMMSITILIFKINNGMFL